MEQYVGLDVSQAQTSICVVDGAGKVLWQGKCPTTPETIATTLRAKAAHAVRIGLETGPLTPWLWHGLHERGLPVLCLDARHAKAALSMQLNKTDRNDALGLAQVVRTGWYKQVDVKSLPSHEARALVGARAQLVGMRTETSNLIRGTLKTFGLVLDKGRGSVFEANVRELAGDQPALWPLIEGLLSVWRMLGEQIGAIEQRLLEQARASEVCRRLMTIPGVGALTAVTFTTAIDTPNRFAKSRSVGAYLGLTPRRYQSGEMDSTGRISKCGDRLLRTYLFEAANALLTRCQRWCALRAWGLRLAKRVGTRKARVAVARKLAVLMHRLWMDGGEFRWSDKEAVA